MCVCECVIRLSRLRNISAGVKKLIKTGKAAFSVNISSCNKSSVNMLFVMMD